jgi:hypothetical protein
VKYPSPKSAEILAEDEQIAVLPLSIDPEAITIVAVEDIFERAGS